MAFGDEDFFYPTGVPLLDQYTAQQLAKQSASKRSRRRPAQQQTVAPDIGGGMNDNGWGFALGGFNTAMGASAMQGNILQNIIDDTTDAIEKENYSRVAQAREQNRMDHEKEMLAMKMGGDRDQEIEQLRAIIKELRDQLANRGGWKSASGARVISGF